ncbi:MAG: NotI family restriction endonuclease [bacterium]
MQKHPLAEVFGFPTDNLSKQAERFRNNKLCPFHNKVPSCTKNSATDPLGVCCIFHEEKPVVTCPIRFTEDWLFTEEAARFFFEPDIIKNGMWTSLREIRLNNKNGKTAGNIDYVLVSYDETGNVVDFGSLEVQAVYISGNVTKPFKFYMTNRSKKANMDWSKNKFQPRPDYLSSSRKRLAPQLIYKGGIVMNWNKKQAVVMQKSFYDTIPDLPIVDDKRKADMAWFIYDLDFKQDQNKYELTLLETIYTKFEPALDEILTPQPGSIEDFMQELQTKLDSELDDLPPDAPTLTDIITR